MAYTLIRSEVIDMALSQVGYQGSSKSSIYSKELDAVKFYNFPKDGETTWCSIFVDDMIYRCVREQTADNARNALCEPNKDNCGAGCVQSAGYFKQAGRWYSKPSDAHKGDKVFFKNSTGIYHAGLVVDWDDKGLYTVEGSTGGAKVLKHFYSYSDSKIAGFGRPRYSSNEPDPDPTPEPTEKKYIVKVGDFLSIRTQPDINSNMVGLFYNGAVVTVLEEKNGWGRISGDCWCSMNYLKAI